MERPETAYRRAFGLRPGPKSAGETLIIGSALAVACGLAWWWLARMGGDGMDMATHPLDVWSAGYLVPTFAMWAVMMVAMMLPSASPMILLFARVPRKGGRASHVALFAGSYLAVWALFSLAASLGQALMVASGLVTEATLVLGSSGLAGGLLIAAGVYQLSPFKEACLDACRSPLSFILRLSRPGFGGTVRLGLVHGAYCLGCCWALMLLLFVGGVTNLAWIAALALLVLAEKAAPVSLRLFISALLVVTGALLVLSDTL
jgi:predicted metal-binding membrane protein